MKKLTVREMQTLRGGNDCGANEFCMCCVNDAGYCCGCIGSGVACKKWYV